MKKFLAIALLLFVVHVGFAQVGSVNLSKAEIENCELIDGKTLVSTNHNGRIYLPVVSYKDASCLKLTYSNFETIGEVSNSNIGSVTVLYTDEDGNEKKAVWTLYRTGKKTMKFNEWEIDTKGNKVSINPEFISSIVLGIGKNKKVDILLSVE